MTAPLFVDESGNIKKVSPEIAAQSGWRPAEKADIEQAIKVKEAESVSGHLKQAGKAAAAGAFDAVTGIPRAITAGAAAITGGEDMLEHVSGNQFLEDLSAVGTELMGGQGAEAAGRQFRQQRQLEAKVNPGTEMAAYAGGQVGGILATGGGSLAGAAQGGTTKALGGGFLARQAGRFAGGFVEGAPLGMTQGQHDAYIEGRHLTAEQNVANGLMGGILGGGLSAGAGATGEGLSKVFGKAREGVQALAEKTSEGSFLRKALGTNDEAVANTIKSTLGEDLVSPEVTQHVRDGFSGKNLAALRAETEGAAAREMRSAVNQIESSTKNLSAEWRELKASNVAKTIARDEGSAAQQSVVAQDALGSVRSKVEAMKADPVMWDQRTVQQIARPLEVAERRLGDAIESGRPEEAFVALDRFKKDVGLAKLDLNRSMPTIERDTKQVAVQVYNDIRDALTHESWGEAGAMQKNVNAAYEEYLSTRGLFNRQFLTETGKEGFSKTYGADPAKLETWVGGLGQARNDLKHAIVEQHLDSTQKLAKALAEAGELTPAKAAELKSIESAAQKFQATVSKVQKQVSAVDQAQNFIATTTGSQGVFSGATIAGSVVGGLPGAAIGMGLDAVMNPGKFLAQRMKFEAMALKTADRLGSGLDRFFGGMGATGIGAKVAETAQAVGRTAKTAAVPGALGAFGAVAKTPELAFEKRRQEIIDASQAGNGGVRKALAAEYGDIPTQDPHGFAGAVMTATNALDFLRGKMPAGGPDLQSLTPNTSQLQPSKVEIQEFAEVWNAVQDPLSIIDAIGDGEMPSPDAMEAVQTVYPRMYQQWQVETMTRLRKMDAAGEEVPIRQRLILDSLLSLDGAGEPTFAPSFGAQWGNLIGTQPAQQGGGPPPPRASAGSLSGSAKTRTLSQIGGM